MVSRVEKSVYIVVVVHRDPSSTIRRMIYSVLEKGAVLTDLGWVPLSEYVLDRLEELDKREKALTGREALRIYRVYLDSDTFRELMTRALEDPRNEDVKKYVRALLRGELKIPG